MGPIARELRRIGNEQPDWFRVSDAAHDLCADIGHRMFGNSMAMYWTSDFPDVMSEAIEAAEALGL